jgi:hypothetical protein
LGFTQTFHNDVFWDESRPNENGRNVVVSRAHGDILPTPWNASTRVHEMGGLSWLVCESGTTNLVCFLPKRLIREFTGNQ